VGEEKNKKTTAHKAANYMGQQQKKKRRQSAFWKIDASKEGVQKKWRATFVGCLRRWVPGVLCRVEGDCRGDERKKIENIKYFFWGLMFLKKVVGASCSSSG